MDGDGCVSSLNGKTRSSWVLSLRGRIKKRNIRYQTSIEGWLDDMNSDVRVKRFENAKVATLSEEEESINGKAKE